MERKYKTEMHCHSRVVSACAGVTPEQIVEQYLEWGYSTVVLTEHLTDNYFERLDPNLTNLEKMECYLEGYRQLKAAAGDKLNILLGAEIRFPGCWGTDFLIYGATEEYFLNNPEMVYHDRWWNCSLVHNNGNMIFQAHPFRYNMMLCEPHIIDGIEVYNGHPGQKSHNEMSEKWVELYPNLKVISGSDHHDLEHLPTAGILTSEPITSNEQLLRVLRSGEYDLIRDEETRIRAMKALKD